ncbi:MAG TPA: EAL domain-containing protein [Catenuloplanes sp.]|jgi:diguanylate cyclase (GGDEF)-like protein
MGASPYGLTGLRALGYGGRRASPLLLTSGLILAFSAVWFLANLDHPRGPLVVLWLPSPLSAAVVTVVYWRTFRTERLPLPTRRFWRHLSLAGALVGAGSLGQAYDALDDPLAGGPRTGPVMLTFHTCAIAVVMWSLYRLPLGVQTRGERVRVALDGGTVMLATAAFLWHFQTRPQLAAGADRATALVTSAIVAALALVAVFAVAKVVLSSFAFIDKSALRLLAWAILLGSVASLPQQYLADRPYLMCTQVSVPAVLFIATWAGERQRNAGQNRPEPAAGVGQRPFSALPYLAVAAVDALLMVQLWSPGQDARVIGAVAVALTGLVVFRQITAFQDNRRLLGRLHHGATHDTLTRLPNRRLFNERLQQALGVPGHRAVSVALIDLDDFKAVNDNLGHETGDVLLIEVAQRLTTCMRGTDTVSRLGGDEFVVILDGAEPAGAAATAERIISALAAPVVAQGHDLLIRASIGIAGGCTGDEPSDLLRHADIAMYAAKNLGGNRYLPYQPGMAGAVANHAQLGAELRQAIIMEEFFLLYQPIVTLEGVPRTTGAEALVRWTHPVFGTLPPSQFIPLAERNGLIVPLGRWIIRQACRQLAAWSAEHGAAAAGILNVNVSARELREPGFAGDVAATLAETGIAPERVVVEVTETTVLELGDSVVNLRALRDMGVRIALDDFGTGQSSLTLLQNCPVDQLKLDRSFTQAVVTTHPTVAAAVLQMAHVLGLHVVAEGVETRQQAEQLRRIGYQSAQGCYFTQPVPAEQIGERLRREFPPTDPLGLGDRLDGHRADAGSGPGSGVDYQADLAVELREPGRVQDQVVRGLP